MALIVVHKSPTVVSTVEKPILLLSSSSLLPLLARAEARLMKARKTDTANVAQKNGHGVGRLPYSRCRLVTWAESKVPWTRGEDILDAILCKAMLVEMLHLVYLSTTSEWSMENLIVTGEGETLREISQRNNSWYPESASESAPEAQSWNLVAFAVEPSTKMGHRYQSYQAM